MPALRVRRSLSGGAVGSGHGANRGPSPNALPAESLVAPRRPLPGLWKSVMIWTHFALPAGRGSDPVFDTEQRVHG